MWEKGDDKSVYEKSGGEEMNVLKKDDFYTDAIQNDWVTDLDIKWAYEHYVHLNTTQVKEYWQKESSVSVFLLYIEDIGTVAFHYYLTPIMQYIQEQSFYWDENFDIFDGRPIDDDAVCAFDSFPRILQRRFFEKNGKLNRENCKMILQFVNWALDSLDSFNREVFLDKEVTRKEYQKLKDSLRLNFKVR